MSVTATVSMRLTVPGVMSRSAVDSDTVVESAVDSFSGVTISNGVSTMETGSAIVIRRDSCRIVDSPTTTASATEMDNGGPTATHALLAGSRAIDAAVDANCPVVDQRGFLRDDRCDTGSFEFGASEKPVAVTISGSGRPDIH